MVLEVNNMTANAGDIRDMGLILRSEDPMEEGMATHFRYSCPKNHMDRGDWQATVHGVTKSQT